MKKTISILLVLLLLCGPVCTAVRAESYTGGEDWTVTFTARGQMQDSHTGKVLEQVLTLQPGDDITFTVNLANLGAEPTEWYLKNEALQSLEDSSTVAEGGAYSYRLTYLDAGGETRVLYDSDTVGGVDASAAGEGLHEATDALKDYIYLVDLAPGATGVVTLRVALDGESQGNDYQSTLADLSMQFAVALKGGDGPSVVKTGDETRLFPLYVIMAASGLLLLGILVWSLIRRRKQRKEARK